MGILTRYLLRAHLGPFFFAFTALTGLLFLNAIAQRLEALVGRGLGWEVILEFAVLSLPHTVALTLPMAVLVSVLYTFGDLAANNEVTAMSAGGVKPSRILLPLVMAGGVVTLGMLYFNDQVLPEANHSLKNLLVDIGNKSPTLELREQVVNEIRADDGQTRYYLQAARIDRQRNVLFDVTIYDVSEPTHHRTTYAERGVMAFNELGTDLYLTLYDGVIYEAGGEREGGFTRVSFEEQVVPLRGVGDILERRTGGSQRSDREMSIAMLAESAREKREEAAEASREIRTRSREAVREALGVVEADSSEARGGSTAATVYARTAGRLPRDDLTRNVALVVRTKATQERSLRMSAARYRVEIHKKYTISFACLVFVLIGAPIAVRFPRGGVGMTIAVSVGVFAIYWMGLIGGERLADRGLADPALAMWTPNIVFFLAGLAMSMRLGRWVATARGGGWDDLLFTLKRAVAAPVRRLRGETGG